MLALHLLSVTGTADKAGQLSVANATLFTNSDRLLVHEFVENSKHRTVGEVFEFKVREQQLPRFGKFLQH